MYLDIIDGQRPDEDERFDETSKISLRDILEKTGFDMDQANKAATIIQTAFRGHYTKMRVAESQGKVQWQRALINTLNILKKAGVPQEEIIKSLPTIQVAYRGYYTNKNIRMKMDADQEISKEEEKTHEPIVDPRETVQAVAWLEMIYEDSISSFEIMDEAARVIQRAYKRHRTRRTSVFSIQKVISSRSFVVEGILDILRQSAFDKIISRDDIPKELGTREDLKKAMELLKQIYKDRLRDAKVPTEEKYEEEMETVPADAEKLDEMVEEEKMAKPSGTEDEEILVEDLTGEPIEVVEEQAERDKREEQEIEEEVEQEIEQEVEQEEEQERKIEEEEEVQQEKEEKEEEEEEVQQEKEEKEEEEEEQEKEEEREEQEEEQEMPHEATSANDTAGLALKLEFLKAPLDRIEESFVKNQQSEEESDFVVCFFIEIPLIKKNQQK
ncbi:neurofilament medium polypeptide-like [Vespula squamosa]|uniref:Neurofilament medium polypeptide-like n=1 Tax=Vespula squamosa TaxID=30214 RepID=A0ABD2A064_VESSQ